MKSQMQEKRKKLMRDFAVEHFPLTMDCVGDRERETVPWKEENIMWIYEKRLEYPVNITKTCPKTAQLIISQYGGPDGELSASMRYLAQRYTMPDKRAGDLLTDIGTEELAHMEIICAMVYQLTKNLTPEEAKTAGFDAYYIDHTTGALAPGRGGAALLGH